MIHAVSGVVGDAWTAVLPESRAAVSRHNEVFMEARWHDGPCSMVPRLFVLPGRATWQPLPWVRGTRYLTKKKRENEVSFDSLIEQLEKEPPTIVSGTAV